MSTDRFSVTAYAIDTLLTWVKTGEIAIPEIQRPFVWEATQVRNLLDSLYHGYPVGYLIAWKNPSVRLKDGTTASGKRILIDGQQRVTALMAAILGREVVTQDYETTTIRIAFNPQLARFEVANPAIRKDPAWIADITAVFDPAASIFGLVGNYVQRNPATQPETVASVLEKLRRILNNRVGIIELADDLDIETVTEIFIRVNSAGKELSQADFAMSKIAVDERHGGHLLRKAIDYFCHLAVAPEFLGRIKQHDPAFAASEFFPKITWLAKVNDDLYDPSYTDMLRVAFMAEFGRGRLQDLVALLSGRNFVTKTFEEEIAEASFASLRQGVHRYVNQANFQTFVMILKSAGFITRELIGGQSPVNFAYVLYLIGRRDGVPASQLERIVRRWYAMSALRGRYTGSSETIFDVDLRQVAHRGLAAYTATVLDTELPDSFWTGMLPQLMETSAVGSAYFKCFQAAQVKLGDPGFLSRDITVASLLQHKGDVHHLYPKAWLKAQGHARGSYNQIANYALAQSDINIRIGAKPPAVYFAELAAQVRGGKAAYGGITDEAELRENLAVHCVPAGVLDGEVPAYAEFLAERRRLMAGRMKMWFEGL